MDLEIIILSEISQAGREKKNTVWYHLYVESKNNINKHICKIETDSQRKQTNGYQRREGKIRAMRLRCKLLCIK